MHMKCRRIFGILNEIRKWGVLKQLRKIITNNDKVTEADNFLI